MDMLPHLYLHFLDIIERVEDVQHKVELLLGRMKDQEKEKYQRGKRTTVCALLRLLY